MFRLLNESFLSRSLVVGIVMLSFLPVAAVSAASAVIEEVMVTAQRVSESTQEVPIAVTALTGEMLDVQGIITPSDLQMSTPGMSFTATNAGGSNLSIRGIGQLISNGDSGVSSHINEIPISSNLNTIEFFDMTRVEILRGPQGTLFGRNATGGAINFVTRRPDFESVNGYLDVEGGNYSNFRMKGAFNFPISDNFAIRVAGMSLERDGYIENLAAGQVANNGVGAGIDTIANIDSNIDGRDIESFRITAAWSISDNADLWLMYSNFKEDDDRARISNQICVTNAIPTLGCEANGVGFEQPHAIAGTGGILLALGAGAYPLEANVPSKYDRRQPGFREMHTDFDPIFEEKEEIWAFGYNMEFDKFSFDILGAYQERDFLAQQDYFMDVGALLFDGSVNLPISAPAGQAGDDFRNGPCSVYNGTSGVATAGNPDGACALDVDGSVSFTYDQSDLHSEYWAIESKFATNFDGPLNFTVGASVYDEESNRDYYVLGNAIDFAGAYPGFFLQGDDPAEPATSKGNAVFGELYYDFSDDLKFTFGLRYNVDERGKEGNSVLLNAFDLNQSLNGALGSTTLIRTGLAGFVFGAPLGQQTALAELYGIDAATIAAAELTPPASPERIGLATTIPSVPQSGESRAITNSPNQSKFREFSGRLGFDWNINDNSMVYAFISRGYKPGGLNDAIPVTFQDSSKFTFLPEEITSFEIGSKNTLLDGTMILNGSIFYYDYTGLQISRVVNNATINDNIDATIFGLETELHWRPSVLPNLEINAAYSYVNTEVGNSISIDPTNRTAGDPNWIVLNNLDQGATIGINFVAENPAAVAAAVATCAPIGGTVPIPNLSYPNGIPALWSRSCIEGAGVTTSDGLPVDLKGNELQNTPAHSISVGAGYTWNIPAIEGTLTLRWDYYWQAKSFAREFNTKGDRIDSWDQHNASLIYQNTESAWSGRLFVRNLGNEDNVTGQFLTSDTSGFYRNYFLTEPRVYGLSVRYDFDRG